MPITPETRKTLPQRGRGKLNLLLDVIRENAMLGVAEGASNDEVQKALFREIMKKALDEENPAQAATLLRVLLDKCIPSVKPSAERISIDMDGCTTPTQKAERVLEAVACGDIPVDIAATLVGAIKDMLQICEITELAKRLEAIEQQLARDAKGA